MPRFRITHAIEAVITHEIDADTAAEANGLAVELTLQRANEVHDAHPDVTFGSVDDRWAPPALAE